MSGLEGVSSGVKTRIAGRGLTMSSYLCPLLTHSQGTGWSAGWEETKVHSALRDPALGRDGSSHSGKNLEIDDAYEINSSKTLVELDFKHENYWYWKFANMNEAPADENG